MWKNVIKALIMVFIFSLETPPFVIKWADFTFSPLNKHAIVSFELCHDMHECW